MRPSACKTRPATRPLAGGCARAPSRLLHRLTAAAILRHLSRDGRLLSGARPAVCRGCLFPLFSCAYRSYRISSSEEHTSALQSPMYLLRPLLLAKNTLPPPPPPPP